MKYSHLFGPVQSRRLGFSLGIDLVPSKTCTLNCVYCECGATDELTLERKKYVPADAINAELTAFLGPGPGLDHITFGGSGEPTLNTDIGIVAAFCKQTFPQYRRALLTNGTLLHLPEVRKELLDFDVVLPTLNAVSAAIFRKVNRPHQGLDNGRSIEGLASFRKEFAGEIWLEVFIVPGVNDTPEELRCIGAAAAAANPDRVQINTLDRPGTCAWVRPASPEQLRAVAAALAPLPVEIISRQVLERLPPLIDDPSLEKVRSLLARRPSTIEEISGLTGLPVAQAKSLVDKLIASQSIALHRVGDRTFFRTVSRC